MFRSHINCIGLRLIDLHLFIFPLVWKLERFVEIVIVSVVNRAMLRFRESFFGVNLLGELDMLCYVTE